MLPKVNTLQHYLATEPLKLNCTEGDLIYGFFVSSLFILQWGDGVDMDYMIITKNINFLICMRFAELFWQLLYLHF